VQPISAEHAAVGLAIRERRVAKSLSQDALGEVTRVSGNWIGMIERGEGNVCLTDLMRIARALDVPSAELVAAADQLGSAAA